MGPQDVQQWFDLALAVAAVVAVVGTLFRWINKRFEARIVSEIREATYQIQPTSNGGKSLNDLHKKVDSLATDVGLLKKAVLDIEDELEDMR